MTSSWWAASSGSWAVGSADRLSTWSNTGEAKRWQQGLTQPWDWGSWNWKERAWQCVEKGNECSHGKEVVTENGSATECAITTRSLGKRSTTFPRTECDESPNINGEQLADHSVISAHVAAPFPEGSPVRASRPASPENCVTPSRAVAIQLPESPCRQYSHLPLFFKLECEMFEQNSPVKDPGN